MRVYLETFGCQMNELDSELVHSQLSSLGYQFVDRPEEAQIVLYNTCSVREQAEQKAYSRIGIIGQRKKAGERLILGVIGCMAERDGIDMMRRHPQVDLLCGPAELDRLPQLIDNARTATEAAERDAIESADAAPTRPRGRVATPSPRTDRVALAGNKTRRTATLAAAEDNLEALDLSRSFQLSGEHARRRSAYVRITRGCNKFCTYCVVPHTRGAEVHRPPDHIVDECKKLVDAGAIEITLLGQTVNHYRYTHGASVSVNGVELAQVGPGLSAFRASPSHGTAVPGRTGTSAAIEPGLATGGAGSRVTTFADLLARIHHEVPGLQRLRFVTSYPRDFGPDILGVMRDCPRICRYLHAPAQSGSDRILKLMNRGYSVGEYLEFVHQALETLPDAAIAGDIIVGFPTESDDDFRATVDLVRRVPFKNNFIFKYSPRPGTTAIDRFPDNVPDEVKRARNNALLAVQSEVSARVHASWVGRSVPVLFDDVRVFTAPKSAQEPPRVELGWERKVQPSDGATANSTVQAVGRTPQDLIVAVDCTSEAAAQQLLGSICPIQIKTSMPLLLRGSLTP
jgi:tRNA-2-methylthio-N6-dimethylallyladenosine synthase